jgi:membrane-associated phospholipid phosphatase
MLAQEGNQNLNPDKLRMLNLVILKRASIKVNTFPSAHVASTISASLSILSVAPVVGVAFLVFALSIAGGAVLGRYHYAVDAVLGFLVAVVVFCSEC